jgi:hypothetical protein
VVDLDAGLVSSAQATDILDQGFAALVAQMERLGIVGNQTIINLMADIRNRGLEVASMLKFVDDNLRTVADSLLTVVQGSLIETQEEFDRLGRLAVLVFNEMIANGASVVEAIDAIGPALDALIDRLKDTDLKGTKAFRALRRWRRLINQNREILDGFSALIDIMEALANIGLLTQDTFDDLLGSLKDMQEDLADAGVTGRDAMILLAPYLQRIIDLARENGVEIDAATQALIDQAREYGLLGDAAQTPQETMQAGFESVVEAIERLIVVLGGVGPAVETIGDDFEEAAAESNAAIDSIADGVETTMDFIEKRTQKAADAMNESFDSVEDNLVGNTVFRNISEKGSAFLDKLGEKALEVSGDMTFGDAENRIPGINTAGVVPNFIVSAPSPSLSEGRKGMTKFEQQNLAFLSRLVDAVLVSGKRGGGGNTAGLTNLRQSIGEVLREASLDGDAEIHVDSVGRLN